MIRKILIDMGCEKLIERVEQRYAVYQSAYFYKDMDDRFAAWEVGTDCDGDKAHFVFLDVSSREEAVEEAKRVYDALVDRAEQDMKRYRRPIYKPRYWIEVGAKPIAAINAELIPDDVDCADYDIEYSNGYLYATDDAIDSSTAFDFFETDSNEPYLEG